MLVGGIVMVCGALDLFGRLNLTADQVAVLETGVIMVVSAIRMWVDRARGINGSPVYSSKPTPPAEVTDA